ncbi:hypothetical protein TUN205_12233 [Pyrenophora tritici-repentis]|nr:hypothetical protein TUN205_12233 [Pyrenophora tritici-repentis]
MNAFITQLRIVFAAFGRWLSSAGFKKRSSSRKYWFSN